MPCRPRESSPIPNCSTIQLVVALKPLHDAAGIERIDVATYQSASGAGRAAVEELARQSIQVLSGKGPVELEGGYKQTAFNCIPHIDEFQENGYTREEMKLVLETQQDPRRCPPAGECHRGARAGVLRAFRGGAHQHPAPLKRCAGARTAEKCARRHAYGRAAGGRVPHGGYRGSEPRHSLCRENSRRSRPGPGT